MSHCTISRRMSFSEPTRLRSVLAARTLSQIISNNSNRCFLSISIVGCRPYPHLYHAIHNRMLEATAKMHKQIARTTGDVFVGHFAFWHSRRCGVPIEFGVRETFVAQWSWWVLLLFGSTFIPESDVHLIVAFIQQICFDNICNKSARRRATVCAKKYSPAKTESRASGGCVLPRRSLWKNRCPAPANRIRNYSIVRRLRAEWAMFALF